MNNLPVCLVLAWLVLCPLLQAVRLPIKTYTTADGLPRDHVLCIVQDSHGFIWFCTAEGLSRFDGYQFTNYRTEQGLPSNVINDFVETRQGIYWVATSGGLCRFDPAGTGPSRFDCDRGVPGPSVLYADRDGGVWCGGDNSLVYRGPKAAAFTRVELPIAPQTIFTALLIDRHGTLWAGASTGLYRRDPDGKTGVYTIAHGLPNDYIMALAEDREGRLWAGTRVGLIRFDFTGARPQMRVYSVKDGLPGPRIESLLETSEGTLWVGTSLGIAEGVSAHRQAHEFQSYTLAQGLSAWAVGALAEDRDGNLWIGTFGSGAMKVAHSGFTSYTEADGAAFIVSIRESRQGDTYLVTRTGSGQRFARFEGGRFTTIQPPWPKNIDYFGWGRGQVALQDRTGEWWIGTGRGLCRFAATPRMEQLAAARPKAVYTKRDGLAGNDIFKVFEDSRGDIWIGTIGLNNEDGLSRWNRATENIETFLLSDGLPQKPVPTAFAEDGAHNVWIGLFHGGLVRHAPGGTFTLFNAATELPGTVKTLFLDSAGRLWIGTTRGLVRVDEPGSDRPRFIVYTTAQGLSSNFIAAIASDCSGRIYAATGRGIDRFEPQPSGLARIRHYTAADGIVPGELELAFRDRQGSLWFSTPLGVSRLTPTEEKPRPPPPVLLTGLSIGGVSRPISDLGESTVSGLRLSQAPLRADFVGLDFAPGETLHYQYRLEGADDRWSPPTDQRSVVFAGLAPGRYRFLVRAIASDGSVSPQPAAVGFIVLPPFWRTWWFVSACAVSALLILFALHRYRLAQVLAVAAVRNRIATDLHDDIGASLSQIAVLSELAQARCEEPDTRSLFKIAEISRGLVDSMSDIVWAINPDHDRLSNLVYRMRRFAADLLECRKIGLQFRSTIADRNFSVGADFRRQVFLIFKEAIHNAARHSGAELLEVDLDRVDGHLTIRVHDNGKGFNACAQHDGSGLLNMRKRAAAIGGSMTIESARGHGSTLCLTVPLGGPKRWQR